MMGARITMRSHLCLEDEMTVYSGECYTKLFTHLPSGLIRLLGITLRARGAGDEKQRLDLFDYTSFRLVSGKHELKLPGLAFFDPDNLIFKLVTPYTLRDEVEVSIATDERTGCAAAFKLILWCLRDEPRP